MSRSPAFYDSGQEAAQRARIATLRSRLTSRLGFDGERVAQFRELPVDAFRVTAAGLEELLDDPDIESIQLDRLMRPSLFTTIPRIGAQAKFASTRASLLEKRIARQAEIDAGNMPDFLPETKH